VTDDPHGLQRFLDAQERAGTYEQALEELRAGQKTTHWIWFVFPQIAGLGRSATARLFAIDSLAEAEAYARHPLLGPRLRECSQALLGVSGRSAREILGETDATKLRSSMTLFAAAAPDEPVFREVLDRYYEGERDEETERRLDQRLPD
jgi:uncharacterized protein (DUF1810 family)